MAPPPLAYLLRTAVLKYLFLLFGIFFFKLSQEQPGLGRTKRLLRTSCVPLAYFLHASCVPCPRFVGISLGHQGRTKGRQSNEHGK